MDYRAGLGKKMDSSRYDITHTSQASNRSILQNATFVKIYQALKSYLIKHYITTIVKLFLKSLQKLVFLLRIISTILLVFLVESYDHE